MKFKEKGCWELSGGERNMKLLETRISKIDTTRIGKTEFIKKILKAAAIESPYSQQFPKP